MAGQSGGQVIDKIRNHKHHEPDFMYSLHFLLPRQIGIYLYINLVRYTISKIVITDKLIENGIFLLKHPVSIQNIFDIMPINARYNGPCITKIPNVTVPNLLIMPAIYRVCTSKSAAIIIVATLPITPKI